MRTFTFHLALISLALAQPVDPTSSMRFAEVNTKFVASVAGDVSTSEVKAVLFNNFGLIRAFDKIASELMLSIFRGSPEYETASGFIGQIDRLACPAGIDEGRTCFVMGGSFSLVFPAGSTSVDEKSELAERLIEKSVENGDLKCKLQEADPTNAFKIETRGECSSGPAPTRAPSIVETAAPVVFEEVSPSPAASSPITPSANFPTSVMKTAAPIVLPIIPLPSLNTAPTTSFESSAPVATTAAPTGSLPDPSVSIAPIATEATITFATASAPLTSVPITGSSQVTTTIPVATFEELTTLPIATTSAPFTSPLVARTSAPILPVAVQAPVPAPASDASITDAPVKLGSALSDFPASFVTAVPVAVGTTSSATVISIAPSTHTVTTASRTSVPSPVTTITPIPVPPTLVSPTVELELPPVLKDPIFDQPAFAPNLSPSNPFFGQPFFNQPILFGAAGGENSAAPVPVLPNGAEAKPQDIASPTAAASVVVAPSTPVSYPILNHPTYNRPAFTPNLAPSDAFFDQPFFSQPVFTKRDIPANPMSDAPLSSSPSGNAPQRTNAATSLGPSAFLSKVTSSPSVVVQAPVPAPASDTSMTDAPAKLGSASTNSPASLVTAVPVAVGTTTSAPLVSIAPSTRVVTTSSRTSVPSPVTTITPIPVPLTLVAPTVELELPPVLKDPIFDQPAFAPNLTPSDPFFDQPFFSQPILFGAVGGDDSLSPAPVPLNGTEAKLQDIASPTAAASVVEAPTAPVSYPIMNHPTFDQPAFTPNLSPSDEFFDQPFFIQSTAEKGKGSA